MCIRDPPAQLNVRSSHKNAVAVNEQRSVFDDSKLANFVANARTTRPCKPNKLADVHDGEQRAHSYLSAIGI
jgi:hypothetical protein